VALFLHPRLQHAFNTPYQLGTQSRDSAADGELGSFAGRAGDVVLLATDGLFDNLSELDIRILVSEFSSKPAQKIADTLARVAQEVSFDENRRSPFEVEAERHGVNFKGGKVDDTTVVILKLVAV
jgi:protein phosphatase PTC7